MKKRRKTLVSCLLALTMLLGMTANCLAANTMTIEKVEILDETGRVKETYAATDANIGVQIGAEVIRVTGKLADATTAAAVSGGAATYLAYDASVDTASDDAIVLDNNTIEYIDQMTTNADGTVSFTYRNRDSIAAGTTITAKVGGTDVATVASTSYVVETDLPILSLTSDDGVFTFAKGLTNDAASFVLSVNGENALPETVKLFVGSLEASAAEFSYDNGVIKITSDFLNKLEVGKHAVKVTADSYNEAYYANAFVVSIPQFTEEQEGALEEELGKVEIAPEEDGSVVIPSLPVESAPYGVEVSVAEEDNNKVTVTGTTVALKEGQDFAKVTITVSVPGSTQTKEETVYMIPSGKTVSYGNIGLHTTAGKDAFTYTAPTEGTEDEIKEAKKAINEGFTSFVQANNASIVEDIATALSIALDDTKAAKLPHFASALDFDGDSTKLTLAEYRIYRLLMSGTDSVHTFTAVNDARAALANNN